MTNVLLGKEYPDQYDSETSTRVSNALLVGQIFGQIVIGLTCDYMGRKAAIVVTTLMIVFGGILATASNGVTIQGMFWMMTVTRGMVGFGAGGKSTTATSNYLGSARLLSQNQACVVLPAFHGQVALWLTR